MKKTRVYDLSEMVGQKLTVAWESGDVIILGSDNKYVHLKVSGDYDGIGYVSTDEDMVEGVLCEAGVISEMERDRIRARREIEKAKKTKTSRTEQLAIFFENAAALGYTVVKTGNLVE